MPMPKGHKVKGGYFTVTSIPGADDYKLIAKKCTDMGYNMQHSTARNVFLSAMKKIACSVQSSSGLKMTENEIFEVARSSNFQEGVAEILSGR